MAFAPSLIFTSKSLIMSFIMSMLRLLLDVIADAMIPGLGQTPVRCKARYAVLMSTMDKIDKVDNPNLLASGKLLSGKWRASCGGSRWGMMRRRQFRGQRGAAVHLRAATQ